MHCIRKRAGSIGNGLDRREAWPYTAKPLTDAPNFGGLSVMDVIVRETSIGGGMIATPCCRRPVGGSHGEDAMIDAARIFASACTVAAR